MRLALLALAAALLGGCHFAGDSCCSNEDCPGNFVCSAICETDGNLKGTCLAPCMVDKDCGEGAVCNLFALSCACQELAPGALDGGMPDAGITGTCAGGVGD